MNGSRLRASSRLHASLSDGRSSRCGLCLTLAKLMAFVLQCAAQQGAGAELLKLRFLQLVGAATYLVIGSGCANPQSPQLKR
jgi:hypothetical protein